MTKTSPADDSPYDEVVAEMRRRGPACMGPMTSWAWRSDPRHLVFTLARYKFVAKMLDGAASVLEAGCGDGFGARIVAQAVGTVTAVDIAGDFIEAARDQGDGEGAIRFCTHDMLAGPVEGEFDAAYSLDVLEHIDPGQEGRFLANMIHPLGEDGVCIIGMPSLESQEHASTYSRIGHVNCKDQPTLKRLMLGYFRNVFMFSMNDEVIHTGFGKMSHYNIALCCGKRPLRA